NASAAERTTKFHFDIPRQPLSDAILLFDSQGHVSGGVFTETDARRVLVGPLNGDYTADEAIKKLLENTNIEYYPIGEGTISVYLPPRAAGSDEAASQDKQSQEGDSTPDAPHQQSLKEGVLVVASRLFDFDVEAPAAVTMNRARIGALGVSTMPEALGY